MSHADPAPHAGPPPTLRDRASRLWVAHAASLLTAAVLLGLFLGFTALAEEVYDSVTEGDGFAPLDHPALALAIDLRTPGLTVVAQALACSGGTTGAVVVGLLLLALLTWHRRDALPAAVLLGGMAGAVAITSVGKGYVGRIRPPLEVALPPIAHSPAFPSGHTLNATVLMGLTVYLVVLSPRLALGGSHRGAVVAVAVAGGLYALVMGLSRVYLAAHWLTDVMAGWAVGVAWTLAVVLAHRVGRAVRSGRVSPRPAR